MKRYLTIASILLLALAACSPAAQSTPTAAPTTEPTMESTDEAMMDSTEEPMMESTDEAMMDSTEEPMMESTDEAMMESTEEPMMDATEESAMSSAVAYNGPDWASLPITNARTGETFTLADFAGKTVFVEPMATWCTNCRRQLGTNVRPAYEQLSSDNVVFVSFSVAENVSDQVLADYADQQGWEWVFAVASTELTAGLTSDYGRGVITPPSTPHFIISPTGTLSALHTGFEGTDTLLQQISDAMGA
ncbi:MAG: TlpA family protein disulfide reductase [Anaerolineaceae bacterium]|nr:TlpA family protein disulfide reductase [Anaerolineaceae bacterium]